jgi:hypothetical protein
VSILVVRFFPTLLFGFLGTLSIFTDGWSRLFVPTMHPSFGDLRSITSTAECFALDSTWSYTTESCDPWQRKYNYPIIWIKTFSFLGLRQSHTFALGVAIFFILLCTLLYWNLKIIGTKFEFWQVASLTTIYISPPLLLLVERGNTDSLIFALLTLLTSVRKKIGPIFFSTALAFLSYFKLFVVGAMVIVFCTERKWQLRIFHIALFATVLLALKDELPYIRNFTAVTFWTSFGISVVPLGLALVTTAQISAIQSFAIGLFLMAVIILFLSSLLNKRYIKLNTLNSLNLEEIRVVSMYFGVLLFSFLAGSSYDYRMVFLIPIMLLVTSEKSCIEWKKSFAMLIISVMYLSRLGVYSLVGDLLFAILLCHLLVIFAILMLRITKLSKVDSENDQ